MFAYASRVDEYVDAVGRIEHASDEDVTAVQQWAQGIDGRILDVGCGPGQWTNRLRELGCEIEGVDPVHAFIDRARLDYPETNYRVGCAEQLDVEDGSVGGVLAWYSLIHSPPSEIGEALAEFSRVIRPGGSMLLGFFTADRNDQFAHAIAPAYFWPVSLLAARIEEVGFRVTNTVTRIVRPERTHGAIVATRLSAVPPAQAK